VLGVGAEGGKGALDRLVDRKPGERFEGAEGGRGVRYHSRSLASTPAVLTRLLRQPRTAPPGKPLPSDAVPTRVLHLAPHFRPSYRRADQFVRLLRRPLPCVFFFFFTLSFIERVFPFSSLAVTITSSPSSSNSPNTLSRKRFSGSSSLRSATSSSRRRNRISPPCSSPRSFHTSRLSRVVSLPTTRSRRMSTSWRKS
jgi:hypothetical protein